MWENDSTEVRVCGDIVLCAAVPVTQVSKTGQAEKLASEIVLQGWPSLHPCFWLVWTTSFYFQVSNVLTIFYRQASVIE